ncbi:MAG: cysteine rich repeat-containing protein [Gammaproteobacteria bacterium]|nr:cysteine rich repeat-containing protein [Gammaproteobacteria bacterium]
MLVLLKRTFIALLPCMMLSSVALADNHGKKLREKMPEEMVISVSVSGCDEEAKKYCDGIDPNSNKMMLCLTAYEDKLSARCKRNIMEAAMAMKMGAAAIQYSARECEADADKYCLDVKPGEGRIVSCIKKNEAKVSKACITALKETGLWDMGR